MRVAVLGGTGTAGAAAVDALRVRGHEVRVLARRAPGAGRVDVRTGEGLAHALRDIEVLVDTLEGSSPRRVDAEPVLVAGLGRALVAARAAGVSHVLSLSILGCDRVPLGFYRTKVAREGVVREAGLPWTILRATQFHGLLAALFGASARFGVLPGLRIPLQPIDPRDVATALADAVQERETGVTRLVAGPQIAPLAEFARQYRHQRGLRRPLLALPAIGAVWRAAASGALTDPRAPRGQITFTDWLRASP